MTLALVAVAIGGFAQATIGFGSGLISVAFLVAAIGRDGVRAVLAFSLVTNLIVLSSERRHAVPRDVVRLFLPSLAAQLLLAPFVRRFDPSALTIAVGVVVIASAVALWRGKQAERLVGGHGLVLAGGISGMMNLIAGIGGPAVVMYAQNAGWSPQRWRPTINAYFALNNISSLAILGLLPPNDARIYVAAVVGVVAGIAVARRLPVNAVRAGALGLSVLGGILAIRTGVIS